jgi:hypothetical protein
MDLVYRVLDDQLIDVDGRRCGRADDLEFEGALGEPPKLSAILSGSGTWHKRFPRPLRPLGERIFGTGVSGSDVIRVPWNRVENIESVIKLRAKASELGLAQGDDRDALLVRKLPKS